MLNIDTKKLLVVNEFEIIEGHLTEAIKAWKESVVRTSLPSSVLYSAIDNSSLVLLYEIKDFNELQEVIESKPYSDFVSSISNIMASDFHQKIVGLVEEVRPRETLIPTTPFMQLRSIEVPLSGIESYLDWRKRRIFEFVKRNNKVHSFLAFHSVLSTNPGVLFIAEFDEDPVDFRNSFLNPEYQVIIKEAGHDHIKGGLNTVEYQLVAEPLLAHL